MITKPEPVPYEVPTLQSGMYGGVGIGYGSGYLNLSVKTGYINKGGWMYEIEAGNFKNNYLKVGIGRVF